MILGDYVLDPNSDPDCTRNACAPKRLTKKIQKIIKHDQFAEKPGTNPKQYRNNIALIKLQDPVPLHNENPTIFRSGLLQGKQMEDIILSSNFPV